MTTLTEAQLRADLREIADSIETVAPPYGEPSGPRVGRRAAVAGAVSVVVLSGGAALAVKLAAPDDVARMNETMTEQGVCGTILTEQAAMVASAERVDGSTIELWVTPTSFGNVATSLRIVHPDGEWSGASGGCGYDDPSAWAGAGSEVADGQTVGIVDVSGRTDLDAATVIVTFTSGTTVTADVQVDGYFVASLTGDVRLYDQVLRVEAAE